MIVTAIPTRTSPPVAVSAAMCASGNAALITAKMWLDANLVDDVLFIAHVDYPYGDDRSGILSDWQRILWNFQLDEDGPLYPGQGEGESAAESEEE